jgi:hypothetical protein
MQKASLIVAALLLAACGSSGLGDLGALGDILGSTSTSQPSDVRGTVDYVDTRAQRIDLDVSYVNNLRDNRENQTIYYTANTRVVHSGKEYRVTDLERGDQITIRGTNDNGRYVADTIEVTRDSSQ